MEQSIFCRSSLQSRVKVYQSRIEDMDELGERIKAAWEELDQQIIDNCIQAVAQSNLVLFLSNKQT